MSESDVKGSAGGEGTESCCSGQEAAQCCPTVVVVCCGGKQGEDAEGKRTVTINCCKC